MSTYSAGKVSVTPRGQYSASTEYERLDIVTDNGSSYMYINNTPATGVSLSTTTHWMEIAQKGATGDQGPQGSKGDKGDKGDTGAKGDKGDKGDTGPQGEQGIQGVPGQDGSGVPAGGTTGQVLSKVDNTDHNVAWTDPTGGGGGGKNLLHNWDFRNPVNQRQVSGAISTGTYFFDRWIRNSGTVTVAAGYLTMASGAVIEQRIEGLYLAGETVTVSVQTDAEIISGTGVFPTAAGTEGITLTGFGTATLGYNAGYMYVLFTASGSQNVIAVKCELGTVSTLHLDPPMDLASENLKCYRYLHVFNQGGAPSAKIGDMPRAWVTEKIMLTYSPPVPMLELPTITIVGQFACLGDNNSINATVSAFVHNVNSSTPEHFLIDSHVTGGSLVSGRHYIVRATSSAARIIFSCEL